MYLGRWNMVAIGHVTDAMSISANGMFKRLLKWVN